MRREQCSSEPLEPARAARIDWSQAVFRLSRESCFGSCPVYGVSVYPDGLVEYEGDEYVRVCGRATRWIDRDEVAGLARAFRDANFLSSDFEPPPDRPRVTDADAANLHVEVSGVERALNHYDPYRTNRNVLTALEDRIDELAHTREWTSCGDGAKGCDGHCRPSLEQEFLAPANDAGL